MRDDGKTTSIRLLAGLALGTGCGVGTEAGRSREAPQAVPLAEVAVAPVTTLPSRLTCVSEASTGYGESVPHVWRATVSVQRGDATLTLARGG